MSDNNNISVISVDKLVNSLSSLFVKVINNGMPLNTIPAPFLWGPPGVGKSDAVYEIGENIEKNTGKKVNITDVRLLLFSPVDLRGVPVADDKHEFADWLMPRIFDMDSSKDVINILFLDELSAAPQAVQAAAYQITLNRTIGEHRLPDNTIVIAAGNRTTDRSVAFRMPNALANRLMHFELEVSFESWKRWARDNGVNPLVVGYLAFDNRKIMADETNLDDRAFQTPRSWNYVSNILNAMGITEKGTNIDSLYDIISGCVGKAVTLEFIAWARMGNDLPMVADIFAGKNPNYPKTQDALYALIGSINAYVSNKSKTITNVELDNMCAYAEKFPADFSMMLYRSLVRDEKIKVKLMKTPVFKSWCTKNSKVLSADFWGEANGQK